MASLLIPWNKDARGRGAERTEAEELMKQAELFYAFSK